MVCRSWKELLHSRPILAHLLQLSKFYHVVPHLHVEGYEDEIIEDSDDEDGTGLPSGEINCSAIVVRAFSNRQVCLDILRRYKEKWEDLIFLGGDYQPHRDHQKMVARFHKLQDKTNSENPFQLNPNHVPTPTIRILKGIIPEFRTVESATSACAFGCFRLHLTDYGLVHTYREPRPGDHNIICTSGITATSTLT